MLQDDKPAATTTDNDDAEGWKTMLFGLGAIAFGVFCYFVKGDWFAPPSNSRRRDGKLLSRVMHELGPTKFLIVCLVIGVPCLLFGLRSEYKSRYPS